MSTWVQSNATKASAMIQQILTLHVNEKYSSIIYFLTKSIGKGNEIFHVDGDPLNKQLQNLIEIPIIGTYIKANILV